MKTEHYLFSLVAPILKQRYFKRKKQMEKLKKMNPTFAIWKALMGNCWGLSDLRWEMGCRFNEIQPKAPLAEAQNGNSRGLFLCLLILLG